MSKKTKKPEEPKHKPASAPPPRLTLAELQALIDTPLSIVADYEGRAFTIEARKLRPREIAALDEIVEAVIPPMTGAAPNEKPNENDPDYKIRRARAEIEARAHGIYWACPIFSAEKPGLQGKDVVEFVQSKLTDTLLAIIYRAISRGGTELAALVNFTSPATSPKS